MNGRHAVPCGALTLLEASGNSRVIVERLAAIGFEAKVLNADVLRGISERDRVNDRIDAEKLVSYFGLNPAVDSSGEQERRQRMHGREHGHLSRFGRSDMKYTDPFANSDPAKEAQVAVAAIQASAQRGGMFWHECRHIIYS